MKNYFLLILACCIFLAKAQTPIATDYTNVPDKAYLHLDKTLYAQGDTIWAKAYVFHRNDNTLSNNSYALHVQILDEDGFQVGTYKLLVVDGLGYGYMPIYNTMKPGFYQIVAHTGYMKNFSQNFFYKTKIEVRKREIEKTIKPFFNKAAYAIGDTAKVTFRVFDEFQQIVPKQRFRYELYHNDEVLKRKSLKCNDDGTVTAFIPVEEGSKDDPLRLTLFYYLNDVDDSPTEINSYIPMVNDDFIVGIYPEGGDLVKGVNTRIAFEVTDVMGKALMADLMLNADGEEMIRTRTMVDGMGFFTLNADDVHYSITVTTADGKVKEVDLPATKSQGYCLSYLRQDAENVFLTITHNFDGVKTVGLWTSCNDQLLNQFDIKVDGSSTFTIPKSKLLTGLNTFTVIDENSVPQSERLVYIAPEIHDITVQTPSKIYSQRKKVTVDIRIPNTFSGVHLSAAVVDSVLGFSPYLHTTPMGAYAMLESELKQSLFDLADYQIEGRNGELYRNLLLLTHGWRRFSWINNAKTLAASKLVDFNRVYGKVKRMRKPVPEAQMTALVLGDALSFSQFSANEEGYFSIQPTYEKGQSKNVVLMARNKKGRDNVTISLENTDTILFSDIANNYKDNLWPLVYDYNKYIKEEKAELDQEPFKLYETKLLKEIVVYGEQTEEKYESAMTAGLSAFSSGSISGKDLLGGVSFSDFVQQASFKVDYDFSNDIFTVRETGSLAVGIITDEDDESMDDFADNGAQLYLNDVAWGTSVSALDFLTKEDIAEIIVLNGTEAYALYGSEGENGVVIVTTYKNDIAEKQNTINRNMAIFGRFVQSREFYSPDFSQHAVDSTTVVDQRVTLHWEPWIETGVNGEASFSFYTDDVSGRKQIILQGMDDEGNFYYKEYGFDVEVINF